MDELDLNIGAQVFCVDGKCGKLAKFVVNPDTWQVTRLIIEDGLLLKQARVLPLFSVERATADEIHLLIGADEVNGCPEYRENIVERETPEQRKGEVPTMAVEQEGLPYAHSVAPPMPKVREKVRYGVSDELAVLERGTPINGPKGQIGKLDHFLVNAPDGKIMQMIAQQGLLFTTRRVIPISMVETISEKGIAMAATEEVLKALPQYEPPDNPARSQ